MRTATRRVVVAAHRHALENEALGAPALRTLVVVSELPFVDDSVGDAEFKATRGVGDANRWSNNGPVTRAIFTRLPAGSMGRGVVHISACRGGSRGMR